MIGEVLAADWTNHSLFPTVKLILCSSQNLWEKQRKAMQFIVIFEVFGFLFQPSELYCNLCRTCWQWRVGDVYMGTTPTIPMFNATETSGVSSAVKHSMTRMSKETIIRVFFGELQNWTLVETVLSEQQRTVPRVRQRRVQKGCWRCPCLSCSGVLAKAEVAAGALHAMCCFSPRRFSFSDGAELGVSSAVLPRAGSWAGELGTQWAGELIVGLSSSVNLNLDASVGKNHDPDLSIRSLQLLSLY